MSQEIICTGRVPRLLLPDRGLEKHYPVNVVTQNSKGKSYRMPLLLIPSISAPEIISSVRAHRTNYDNTCQALDSLEILTPEMLPTCESIPKTDEMNMSYFRLDEAINDAEKQEYDNNSTANGMRLIPSAREWIAALPYIDTDWSQLTTPDVTTPSPQTKSTSPPQFTPPRLKIESNLSTPKMFESSSSSSSSEDSSDVTRGMPTLHPTMKALWMRILKKLCLVLSITEMRYRLEVTFNAATWDDFINRGRSEDQEDNKEDDHIASSITVLNTEQYEQLLVFGTNSRRHFYIFQSINAFLGLEVSTIPDCVSDVDEVEAETETEGDGEVQGDVDVRQRCSESFSDDAYVSYLSTFNIFSEKDGGGTSVKDDVISGRNTIDENGSRSRSLLCEDISGRNSKSMSIYKFDFLKYDRANSNNNEEEEEEERSTQAASIPLHRNKSLDFSTARTRTLELKKCRSVFSLSSSSPSKSNESSSDSESIASHTRTNTHTHTHGRTSSSSSSSIHESNCSDPANTSAFSASSSAEVSRLGLLSDIPHTPTPTHTPALSNTCADRNTDALAGADTDADTRNFGPLRVPTTDEDCAQPSLLYGTARPAETGVTFRDIFPLCESERSTRTYALHTEAPSSSGSKVSRPADCASADDGDEDEDAPDSVRRERAKLTGTAHSRNHSRSNDRSGSDVSGEATEVIRVKTKKELGREKRKARKQSLRHMNDKMYRFMNEAVNKKANEELSELIAIELSKVVALDKVLQKGRATGRGGDRSRSLPELRNRASSGPTTLTQPLTTVRFREVSTCAVNDSETSDMKIAPMPRRSNSCTNSINPVRTASISRTGRSSVCNNNNNNCALLPGDTSRTDRAPKRDSRRQSLPTVPTPAPLQPHLCPPETKRIDIRSKARSGKGVDSPFTMTPTRGLEVSPLRLSRHGSRRSSVTSLTQADDPRATQTGADTCRRRSVSPSKKLLPRISKVMDAKCRAEKSKKIEDADTIMRASRGRRSSAMDLTQGPTPSKTRHDVHKVKIRKEGDKAKEEEPPRSALLAALKVGMPSRLWSLIPVVTQKGEEGEEGRERERGRGKDCIKSNGKLRVGYRHRPSFNDDEASTCVSTSCVNTARSLFVPSPGPCPGPVQGLGPASHLPEEGKVRRLQDDLQRQYDEDVIKHFLEQTEELSY